MNTAELQLSTGKVALIDSEDLPKVQGHCWHQDSQGYVVAYTGSSANRKKIYLHRLVAGTAKGKETDHRFGNTLDNRKSKLRTATRCQNAANAKVWSTPKSSKFKGVCWYRAYRRWKAYIWTKTLRKHLGYFDSEVEAAKAYNEAACIYFGSFARLNAV